MVGLLLLKGADPGARDDDGSTALYVALITPIRRNRNCCLKKGLTLKPQTKMVAVYSTQNQLKAAVP
jgi:ankyrin repeat protein